MLLDAGVTPGQHLLLLLTNVFCSFSSVQVLLQQWGFVASPHSWRALKNALPDAWVSYLFADQILQQPAASFSSSPPDQYPLSDCTFIGEWLRFTFTLLWLFGPIKLKSPPSCADPSLSLPSPPSPIPPPPLCLQVEGRSQASHISLIWLYPHQSVIP